MPNGLTPTDTTTSFRIGPPSPNVAVHLIFIRPVLPDGGMTMEPAIPKIVIPIPLKKGTKADWESTAHNLGQKFLYTQGGWKDAMDRVSTLNQALNDERYARGQDRNAARANALALRSFSSHWTSKVLFPFLPRALREVL